MTIKLGTVLRVVISVTALVLIPWILRDKLYEAFLILREEVNYFYFALAVLAFFFSLAATAGRMHGILHAKQIEWSFFDTLYVTFMGLFFCLFLPSAIGGDIMKAVYLSKHAKSKADVFSCIVIDRFSGFCIVLGLAFLSSALLQESWNPMPAWASWSIIAAMIVCGTAIFIRPEIIPWIFSKLKFLPHRFQEKLNQFYDSLSGFFHNRPLLIQNLAFSLLSQSMFILAYFFIGRSLDAPIPFSRFFMLVPMVTIVSMAPSINGLGVREAGALFLFSMYMPEERALAMTVLVGVLTYAANFSGGIWYFIRGVLGRDNLKNLARQDS